MFDDAHEARGLFDLGGQSIVVIGGGYTAL